MTRPEPDTPYQRGTTPGTSATKANTPPAEKQPPNVKHEKDQERQMTTKQIPNQIQASIHQDAINRVSEFFNASTSDIMNELLQNSRRSGATKVDITLEEHSITVADDGKGIMDPEAVLAFGMTGWDKETTKSEHPAGMGLYAMARREQVCIRSKSRAGEEWQVHLTPDHFVGKRPAPVERMLDNQQVTGTTVTFSIEKNDEKSIKEAVEYYPLPVRINGEPMEQKDFLEKANYIEEWQGIRIGVYLNTRPTIHHSTADLNFHGVIVGGARLPTIKGIQSNWHVLADVRECPQLELTLPARREVVESPFMNDFRQACRTAIYQAMTFQPAPVDVPKKVQDAAKDMGISLPDAAPRLEKWHPAKAGGNYYFSGEPREEIEENSVVMETEDLSAPDQQTLARAANQHGIMDKLLRPNDDLIGYSWYDQLTKATGLRVNITDQDGDHDLDDVRRTKKGLDNQRPDRITITIETKATGRTSSESEIQLLTDLVFKNNDEDYMDDVKPLVTRESNIQHQELADLMLDAFFYPNDDYDSDSYDTQETIHLETYERTAMEMLESKDDAVIATISKAIQRHILYEIPKGAVVNIRIKWSEPTQITLEYEA